LKKIKKMSKERINLIIILSFWLSLFFSVFFIFGGVYFASKGLFGPLPTFEQLENPSQNLATQVYSSDGNVLGTFYYENRTPVEYDDLSSDIINALISTEDERFREHSGIDLKSLLRASIGVFTGRYSGGASTITQQLAKMLFTDVSSSLFERIKQKFKEWFISIQLERNFTKNEILTMYLNKFDFLYQAVGIKSAAKTYFNKLPKDLNMEESATLVGMLKNPSLYNPKKFPKNSLERRNIVLGQLYRNELIDKIKLDSISNLPLIIKFKRINHNDGLAPYFREYLRKFMKNWVKYNKKNDNSYYNIYSDGLKIYTTIDSRLQNYAQESMKIHMSSLQNQFYDHWSSEEYENAPFDSSLRKGQVDTIILNSIIRSERYRKLKNYKYDDEKIFNIFNEPTKISLFSWSGIIDTLISPIDSIIYNKYILHSGLMSLDPNTGYVKAWVGGINHHFYKYDHVIESKRQVGSIFKPFVYAAAIDQHNYTPCKKFPNVQVIFEKEKWGLKEDWIPRNSNEIYGGEINLKQALANSINTITANLMKQVGPKKVKTIARSMGLKSRIPLSPSICLGTPELTIFEMVGAYSTFVNKGVYISPIFLNRIEDKNGIILEEFSTKSKEVLSEDKAFVMINLLKGVINEGSGIRLRWKYGFKNEIAGKTGTTQNQSDGWFVGMVPNLVTGVWTGAEDRAVHFRDISLGQGANMSLPTWAEFMKKVYEDKSLNISKSSFNEPPNFSFELDCDNLDDGFNNFDDDLIEF
tara:strand:- start:8496 stop:10757 length:2262 start_codon:yes stop_codon:yes gene_type:complete